MGERLVILGTIHVDPSSASQAGEIVARLKPSVVALELDESRYRALRTDPEVARRMRREHGDRVTWSGVPILLISLLERFAGNLTGSPPGKEMVRAADEARRVGAILSLIDLPIDRTIGMLKTIPLNEKLKLVADSLASLVVMPFGGGRENLGELADGVMNHLDTFRGRYPVLSRLLIDTREEHMVDQIKNLLDGTSGKVVVIVGLGHMASLAKKLAGYPTTFDVGRGYRVGSSWTIATY